jgi:hypothetical protein
MTLSRAAAGGDTADATPESGIGWIYHFQPDGTAALIPNAAVERALADHVGWTWVHLSLADVRCRAWIPQHAPLSELAREILLGPDEHLRLDVLGHEIVGVMPDLHQDIAQATDALVRLRFVMTERMLISARRMPAHSVEINGRAIESGKRFPSAVSLLDAVIDQFADAIGHMAERLGSELDSIEDYVMHDELSDQRLRIGRVRLQAVRVHRQLAQLRGMFHRIEPRMVATRRRRAGHARAAAEARHRPRSRLAAGARAAAARRSRRQNGGNHQPPAVHAVSPHRLLAAADAGHRFLRHEHQGFAVAKHRRGHLDGLGRRDDRQRAQLLGAAPDAGVLALRGVGHGPPLRRAAEHS